MASLLTIYSIESGVEPALVTILSTELSAVTGIQVCRTRSTVRKVTPRVEVQLDVGATTGRRYPTSTTVSRPQEWDCTLRLIVVTDREKNGDKHDDILGRIRVALLYESNKFASSPTNHQLVRVEEAGCTSFSDPEGDDDRTEMSFAVKLGVRQAAWP